MTGDAFEALVDDIRQNGLREPIVVHEGMILDGGNRYRACMQAGVEPIFREFDGDSIASFVLSANLHRRHMTPGQQAAIVASTQDWARTQKHGGDRKADQEARLHLDSVAGRAAESGASIRTQKMADKVAREAPDLAAEVGRGEITLPDAIEKITGKRPGAKKTKPEEPDGTEELRDLLAEQASQFEEVLAENIAMGKIVDADDKLAAAAAEIKRLTAENIKLRERINGLTNEAAEAKRLAKFWRGKAEKAERAAA